MASWTKFDRPTKIGVSRVPENPDKIAIAGWNSENELNNFENSQIFPDDDLRAINDASKTSDENVFDVSQNRDDATALNRPKPVNPTIGETSKSTITSGVKYAKKNDDRVSIIDNDVEIDRSDDLTRENGFLVPKDESEDETHSQREFRRILSIDVKTNRDDDGLRNRREARNKFVRESSPEQSHKIAAKRPSSLYKDSSPSPQRLKKIYPDDNPQLCSTSKLQPLTTNKNILPKPTAIPPSSVSNPENLPNGKSPSDPTQKHVHHVQFNRDSSTKQSSTREIDQNSRRTRSTSSSSSSESTTSDDNSSCGYSEARPPDGGWGWVVVAAAFMVNLIADGITFSFGVIYVEFLNYFKEGKSKTAWIGSLFMAMPLLSGPVASFLTDRYGCRRVTIAGSILATAGFVISAYTNSMELLILTFGVVAGFGLSLCFVAAVVIVAYYFDKRRSFATGLSVCGSGIGTFIFAPVTHYLLSEYGWRGTTLILAGFFFNLAVCGCLMRDLEWTTIRAKEKTAERRANREKKRTRIQSSSGDSFSASSSANTTTQTPHGDPKRSFASTNAMLIESLRQQDDEEAGKLFSSLVSLPTFVKNGEKVPLEVLELLSTRKNVYNVLVQNYPSLLINSRSLSDSGTLNETVAVDTGVKKITTENLDEVEDGEMGNNATEDGRNEDEQTELRIVEKNLRTEDAGKNWQHQDAAYLWWLKKINPDGPLRKSATLETHRRLPTAYLKDIRVHRHSLTYRGAMLNINRYRLRASSCPDIYRNSMTTIAKSKLVSYAGLWEFWDLLVDMLDFSHFSDSRFLLFSISNFLLHTWYDVPYVYLTDNAIEMGFSEADASILISVIGIMNMIGEICLGWAGDRAWVNPSFVYAICMILCGGVTGLIPMVIRDYWGLCTVAGAFGLFIAANYSLTSIILVEVITLDRFTNAYGLLLLVQGIANLMGPPLAGWIYDITGKYDLSFYLAGFFIALSGLLMMVMPLIEFYRRCKSPSEPEKLSPSRQFAKINNV